MDSISSRVNKVVPSLTLSVTNQAKAMKARGEEVYGLAGGEPDQDTPDFIKQAAIQALNDGKTKYTPASGIPELREAIASKLNTDNGIEYDPRQIVVNSGAKQSCFNAILAVCEEGDEVIIPSPYWVSYPEMVRLAGAEPVFVETTAENNWKITPEQFEENMTGRTKMIILNTPGNPTGSVYTADELRALGDQPLPDRQRPAAKLRPRLLPIRKPRRVAEVDEVLGGECDQALLQHRQPADTRVEHPDRVIRPDVSHRAPRAPGTHPGSTGAAPPRARPPGRPGRVRVVRGPPRRRGAPTRRR